MDDGEVTKSTYGVVRTAEVGDETRRGNKISYAMSRLRVELVRTIRDRGYKVSARRAMGHTRDLSLHEQQRPRDVRGENEEDHR